MNNVFAFKPLVNVSARENLEAFFHFARTKASGFGTDLNYDAAVWDITEYLIAKGSRQSRSGRTQLVFDASQQQGGPLLLPDIMAFAKAYLRTQLVGMERGTLRIALDVLYSLNGVMLSQGITAINELDASVLTSAVIAMRKKKLSPATIDTYASRLSRIARFLDANGMSQYPIGSWRMARLHKGGYGRIGKEFEERRRNKLPNEDALDALAQAFRLATEPRDVIVTSVTAIMCSAPERINEVLHLGRDCIVEQKANDGTLYLALRWPGSKGYSDHIKPILPAMSDVVREAIQRISAISAPAQVMAKWYEEHPDQLYLPDELAQLRNKEHLDLEDIAAILGYADRRAVHHWLKRQDLPTTKVRRRKAGSASLQVRFTDVAQCILKRLPIGFPILDAKTGLRFSEALLLVPAGTFGNSASCSRCMFEPVRYHHIHSALGRNILSGAQSVFFRVGLDPDRKMSIKSHQFRHWLNTLAQGANLSQVDIAKWSGRASIHQNVAYDHVSSEEIVNKIREAVGDHAKSIGPLAEIPKNLPVTRAEFAAMAVPTAHVTLYGFCIHDFSTMPCEMFRNCLDCREHVCIKGIPDKTERVRQALEMAHSNLAKAKQAVAEEVYGAEDWVDTHQATVERLEQLLAILTDPNVNEGAVIQLNTTNTYSLSDSALLDRLQINGTTAQAVLGSTTMEAEL